MQSKLNSLRTGFLNRSEKSLKDETLVVMTLVSMTWKHLPIGY